MRRIALLALLLASCTLATPGGDTATGVATEAIEVTPLDGAPAAEAPSATAAEDAAPPAAAATPADAEPAPAEVDDAAATDAETPDAAAAVEEPPPAPVLSPAAQACVKRGGKWVGTGTGLMACVKITRDAGKSCRREADCQGYCLARSRTCAPYTPLFGCNEVLGPGGERTTICLD